MKATIHLQDKDVSIDLAKPIDISLVITGKPDNVNAWYVPPPSIAPVVDGDFVGSVAAGASTNFNTINFNPHAHGTHTECIGHITKEFYSVNRRLKTFFFTAELVTVAPEKKGKDLVISQLQLAYALGKSYPEAIVIRTLPNTKDKRTTQYSHTNPPYLTEEAAHFLREIGIKHLLIDLPSVDKEKDDGKLLAHKAFWDYGGERRYNATITEFIYVPNTVRDGSYILNIQMASFQNDASPSKPTLYKIEQ